VGEAQEEAMKTKAPKLQLATRISVETQEQIGQLLSTYQQAGEPHSIQQIVEAAVLRWCSAEQRRLARKANQDTDV
jgi:hypothetical protein